MDAKRRFNLQPAWDVMMSEQADWSTRLSVKVAKIREIAVDIFIIIAVAIIIACALLYLMERSKSKKEVATVQNPAFYRQLDTAGQEAFDKELTHLTSMIQPSRRELLLKHVPMDLLTYRAYVSASTDFYPHLFEAKLDKVLGIPVQWHAQYPAIATLNMVEAPSFDDLIGNALPRTSADPFEDAMVSQADAWFAICEQLTLMNPAWDSVGPNSRLENALNYLRTLGTPALSVTQAVGDVSQTVSVQGTPAQILEQFKEAVAPDIIDAGEYCSPQNIAKHGNQNCLKATLTSYRNALAFIVDEVPILDGDTMANLASAVLDDPVGSGSGFDCQWVNEDSVSQSRKNLHLIPIKPTQQA